MTAGKEKTSFSEGSKNVPENIQVERFFAELRSQAATLLEGELGEELGRLNVEQLFNGYREQIEGIIRQSFILRVAGKYDEEAKKETKKLVGQLSGANGGFGKLIKKSLRPTGESQKGNPNFFLSPEEVEKKAKLEGAFNAMMNLDEIEFYRALLAFESEMRSLVNQNSELEGLDVNKDISIIKGVLSTSFHSEELSSMAVGDLKSLSRVLNQIGSIQLLGYKKIFEDSLLFINQRISSDVGSFSSNQYLFDQLNEFHSNPKRGDIDLDQLFNGVKEGIDDHLEEEIEACEGKIKAILSDTFLVSADEFNVDIEFVKNLLEGLEINASVEFMAYFERAMISIVTDLLKNPNAFKKESVPLLERLRRRASRFFDPLGSSKGHNSSVVAKNRLRTSTAGDRRVTRRPKADVPQSRELLESKSPSVSISPINSLATPSIEPVISTPTEMPVVNPSDVVDLPTLSLNDGGVSLQGVLIDESDEAGDTDEYPMVNGDDESPSSGLLPKELVSRIIDLPNTLENFTNPTYNLFHGALEAQRSKIEDMLKQLRETRASLPDDHELAIAIDALLESNDGPAALLERVKQWLNDYNRAAQEFDGFQGILDSYQLTLEWMQSADHYSGDSFPVAQFQDELSLGVGQVHSADSYAAAASGSSGAKKYVKDQPGQTQNGINNAAG